CAGELGAEPAAEVARARLLLQAAASLLEREPTPQGRLRALGAALAGMSGPPSAVRLRLDDLELPGGTTERAADAGVAARGPLPFQAELDEAVAAAASASRVRVVLDRDQQLPALLRLAVELDREI